MPLQITRNSMHEIRGQRIMFDIDLALFFGINTFALRRLMKKNTDRFPKKFMFKINKQERKEFISDYENDYDNLTKEIKISAELPYAFTEYGIIMLTGIVQSKKAVQLNIAIVEAFVDMKHLLQTQP